MTMKTNKFADCDAVKIINFKVNTFDNKSTIPIYYLEDMIECKEDDITPDDLCPIMVSINPDMEYVIDVTNKMPIYTFGKKTYYPIAQELGSHKKKWYVEDKYLTSAYYNERDEEFNENDKFILTNKPISTFKKKLDEINHYLDLAQEYLKTTLDIYESISINDLL